MLDRGLVNDVLHEALATGADYAEIFVENIYSSILNMSEKQIKEATSGLDFGAGVRVFNGLFSAYAFTNIMDRENLIKTAKKAASAIKEARKIGDFTLQNLDLGNPHSVLIPFDKKEKTEKVEMLQKASIYIYEANPLIVKAEARLFEQKQDVMIANSEGVFVEDSRCRTRFFVNAISQRDELSESAGDNIGALQGLELYEGFDFKSFAHDVAISAVKRLDAINCPCGKMPVIVNNAFGGVIFHEACGHGLEAAFISKKTSVFSEMLGKKVASDIVSAVDDGTITNAWGSLKVDDEAVPTQRNILIENGVLKGFLVDRLNGRRMGAKPTGSSRRESYRFAPTSRMNNTFIMAGKSSFEDIVSNTEKGLFAAKLSGGSVNPTTGDFNFSVAEGYLVENGKIGQQVKGAKLIGKGNEILQHIDMVGDNLKLACGMCGSSSGQVPTTVGQPTIRVSEIVVGGQK